jgi:CDP-paratose 2-epimerase
MKILVTGGAGFIGSHVAEYYAQQGNDVKVIDNLSRDILLKKKSKHTSFNWDYLHRYSNIEFIRGDIRDKDLLCTVSDDIDIIIHTAGQTAVTTSVTDPRTDFETNVCGTFNVLEAARTSGNDPCVIFCSTNKVFGNNVNSVGVSETDSRYVFSDTKFKYGIPETFSIDHCEHTPYGCSKLSADLYVQDYAIRNEVKAGIFRMSCIYGTRQFGVEDQGWVAWFCIATLLGQPITIYGDGKQVRDVLYVSDLVNAFDAFISRSKKMQYGVFNMGGGSGFTISLLELLDLLEEYTGKKSQITYDAWRPSDQKVYISDIRKAEKILKWKPQVSPKKGVHNIVSWIEGNIQLFK